MTWKGSRTSPRPQTTCLERTHNPEVAGSNPAPATGKAPETGLFVLAAVISRQNFCPTFALTDAMPAQFRGHASCFEREHARTGYGHLAGHLRGTTPEEVA